MRCARMTSPGADVVATARELLEQADALMRRNRANTLDDIPVLTDVMPAVAFTKPPPAATAPVDTGPPSVPLLTENIDVIDEDATLGAEAVEGEPSAWLEFEDANPSVIGDAPDSIAIVPPVERQATPPDEALLASAEHEEIEFTLPAEETAAAEVIEEIAETGVDTPVAAAVDDDVEAMFEVAGVAASEAEARAAIEADAAVPGKADTEGMDAADAEVVDDAEAARAI